MRVHRVEAIVCERLDAATLAAVPGVSDVTVDGDRVSCSVRGPIGPLLSVLTAGDVVELDSTELSLEEVFFSEFEPDL